MAQLHAHLSGSISRQCLHEIWARKRELGEATVEDPLVAMPQGRFDYDLETWVLLSVLLLSFMPHSHYPDQLLSPLLQVYLCPLQ
jgi:hypothetical protein